MRFYKSKDFTYYNAHVITHDTLFLKENIWGIGKVRKYKYTQSYYYEKIRRAKNLNFER